ncbi:hypothetical protein DCS_03262 [Drechmeria coniospora]|uniref:Uncharacterized protein n=1 Tax=Drechmeria coniospora TaxID=98403 RepID=A0A151GYE8_DRECN|nr:hypothetical protein DCS_03262 [Drechmeria coniospora]KYK62115.1 hypothetical protein DCS_03262 [Drechmeria coniospora]
MVFTALTLVLFFVRACCYEGSFFESVQEARKNEVAVFIEKYGLALNATYTTSNEPHQDGIAKAEPSCARNWASCRSTYFFDRRVLTNVVNVTFGDMSNEDHAFSMYQPVDGETSAATIGMKQSTAVLEPTTPGWQAALTISPESGVISSVTGDGAVKLREHKARQIIVTKKVSIECSCAAGHHCTIETLSFYAMVSGTCRVQPTHHCDADQDACYGFRQTERRRSEYLNYHGYPEHLSRDKLPEWVTKNGKCDQLFQFSAKNCRSRDHYREVPCELNTAVLKEDGSPHIHIIFTSTPLQNLTRTKREPHVYVKALWRD